MKKVEPRTVAPLFGVLTLFFAAAVLSRFDGFAAAIPAEVQGAALLASFPLLLVAGAVERQVDHGERLKDFPLWMRIESRPIRWTFTLALTYLGIVGLQVFDVAFGIIDPNPPEVWPQPQRLAWFVMFSFGMSFANFLVATSGLIPALRIITAPFSRLPAVLGLTLVGLLGAGLGWLALQALAKQDEVRALRGSVEALASQPTLAIGAVVAAIVGPWLLSLFWQRK